MSVSPADWLTLYRLTMDLPDAQVRRARLESLDQAFVDAFWQKGLLLARPRVVVRFEDGSPQGHVRAGAGGHQPGIVVMRGGDRGQVNDAMGQPSKLGGDDAVIHRWSVLLHEAAHFSFEQLPAHRLTDALPAEWEALASPLAEYVWAPFLSNLERTRLNEAFADGYSSALLMGWTNGDERVAAELTALADLRHRGQVSHDAARSELPWRHGPSQVLHRVLAAPAWDQCMEPALLLRRALVHSVGGVVDRWQERGLTSVEDLGHAWCSVQLERVCEAFLHARRHHDTGLVERWMKEHPTHPIMQVAQSMRWRAPVSEHASALPWHKAWEQSVGERLEAIGHAWEQAEPLLCSRLQPLPKARPMRLR